MAWEGAHPPTHWYLPPRPAVGSRDEAAAPMGREGRVEGGGTKELGGEKRVRCEWGMCGVVVVQRVRVKEGLEL